MDRLRSWMFVPGHSARMVKKALQCAADAVMLDLEDGVVPALKEESRSVVAASLGSPRTASCPARYVRVNACNTNDILLDAKMVVVKGIEGLVVPKVETPDQVLVLEAIVEALESARGLPIGTVRFMLAIESARGLLAAPLLAAASPRVIGLMFGAEDFSRDLGLPAERAGNARDFIHARSSIVVAAVSAGTLAVDGVWPDLKDSAGLERDAALARALGFAGKSLVHPGQIAAVNEAFSPGDDEISYARALMTDFEQAMKDGHGSIMFRGKLVDRPIYERARAAVRLADRIAERAAA